MRRQLILVLLILMATVALVSAQESNLTRPHHGGGNEEQPIYTPPSPSTGEGRVLLCEAALRCVARGGGATAQEFRD